MCNYAYLWRCWYLALYTYKIVSMKGLIGKEHICGVFKVYLVICPVVLSEISKHLS